jgi:hypothetical protein
MSLPKPPVTCKDGFSMSVQASSFHYCTPRVDGAPFYTTYEIGFPSEREPLLMPYRELSEDEPTRTVYPYVPVEIVAAVIRKHGGLGK